MDIKDIKALGETVKEFNKIKDLFGFDSSQPTPSNKEHIAAHMVGKEVLIRTYSAGVHFGVLKKLDNHQNVILTNSQRIHYWDGACSLSQVAVDGVSKSNTRIAVIVDEILLERAIEIIPLTDKAHKNLRGMEIWKK